MQRVTRGNSQYLQIMLIPLGREAFNLFDHLDRIGYNEWIGCEYRPIEGTLPGLKWAAPYLKSSS